MPLTLVSKSKQKKAVLKAVKTPTKGAITGYEKIVNRLAELDGILTVEIDKALKEQKRLEEELRAVANNEVPDDAKATFNGDNFNFVVTERGEQRTIIDMAKCRASMGDKLFFECAKVLLGDVDKYVTADEKAKFIATARTGSRKGQLVKK